MTLVRFACYKVDKPTLIVLDDKTYDSYLIGECVHHEGQYKVFQPIHWFYRLVTHLDKIIVTQHYIENITPKHRIKSDGVEPFNGLKIGKIRQFNQSGEVGNFEMYTIGALLMRDIGFFRKVCRRRGKYLHRITFRFDIKEIK